MGKNLLEVNDLQVNFKMEDGIVSAIRGVNLQVKKGETLALVGESGSGKSVTSLSIMRLVAGDIPSGEILFNGEDLIKKSEASMRKIRGNKISMIFQDPMTSLNPVLTCGEQIAESIRLHQKVNKKEALGRAIELLKLVGVPMPENRVHEYPHQLSGGLRQRVMIAIALACNPSLLIADEPTTALDVTIQAQILELLKRLKTELDMSIILITHDLGVVAEVAERVAVMYAGQIVEEADVKTLFQSPSHPYTVGLLKSIPKLEDEQFELYSIKGVVPDLSNMPKGCKFNPRCEFATEICFEKEAPHINTNNGGIVACWNHEKVKERSVS